MKNSKLILFDTNILVYNQDQDSLFYRSASKYHQKALLGKLKAIIALQNLLEFSSVMINPKKIKKPLSQKMVVLEIEKYVRGGAFKIIYPNDKTILIYVNLIKRYKLKNARQVFDLFLIATMLSHNVNRILTVNIKDFPYKEIKVITI